MKRNVITRDLDTTKGPNTGNGRQDGQDLELPIRTQKGNASINRAKEVAKNIASDISISRTDILVTIGSLRRRPRRRHPVMVPVLTK